MNTCWKSIPLMLILTLAISIAMGQERQELDVMPANDDMLIGAEYYPEHWPES